MIEDGAIIWPDGDEVPAANGFDLPARKVAIYDWVRQIRGGILAGAFSVERHLSAAIIYFLLGDRVLIQDVQDVFDEGLLGPLTFERRINVAMMIAPHFFDDAAVKKLAGELGELRGWRNSMAHKPFFIHPMINPDGKVDELVPAIQRGKKVEPLTSPLITGLNERITWLIAKTQELSVLAARHGKSEG